MTDQFDTRMEDTMLRFYVNTHLAVNFYPERHTERLEECLLAIELANKGLWDEQIEATHWFTHIPENMQAFITVSEIVENERLHEWITQGE